MRKQVHLSWNGPFKLGVGPDDQLPPRGTPGVYVWAVKTNDGERLVAYVGMAADILIRWRDHVRWFLGGGYNLYDPDELRLGKLGEIKYYEKQPGAVLIEFVSNHAELARQNAILYEWYWAEILDGDPWLLRSVESALIDKITKANDSRVVKFLQNDRISLSRDKALNVIVSFSWPNGVTIGSIDSPYEYGSVSRP